MSKLKSAPIRVVDFTYNEFLKLFNDKDYCTAILKILEKMTVKESLKFIIPIIKNSEFRSYMVSMNNFTSIMERYLEFGNNDDIKTYQKNLVFDYTESVFAEFSHAKDHLCDGILLNSPRLFMEAINTTVSYLGSTSKAEVTCFEEYQKKLECVTIDLAEVYFPEGKTLKVLYGSSLRVTSKEGNKL